MKKIKNYFNLVEIILAMGIIIVCITTIMGMFSYGMNISNEAVMQNYMSNVLEQLGGMVETHPEGSKVPTLTAVPYDENTTSATVTAKEVKCTQAIDAQDPFLENIFFDGATMDTIKIEYKTKLDSGTATDLSAFARLYITADSTEVLTSDDTTVNLNNDTLYIQVTWPATTPYADRVLEGNVLEYSKVMRP